MAYNKPIMDNKRKNMRLPIRLSVNITLHHGRTMTAVSKNISFGGIMVELDAIKEMKTGLDCSLSLLLEGSNNITIDFDCRIIHVSNNEAGMKFLSINSPDCYYHFRNLMISNCPEPDTLIMEIDNDPGILRER